MHFDWYQATVDAHPSALIRAVQNDAGDLCEEVREGRGRHNYAASTQVLDAEGGRIAEVLHGGRNGAPNIATSGAYAQAVSETIRHRWPEHRVTRVDVAEDLQGAGAYDRLEAICRTVAKGCGIKGRAIVPDDPTEGRTYYLGAPSSNVRLRLYDKTAERRAKLPRHRHDEVPSDWARLEVQVRPKKEARELVARLQPERVWSLSNWTNFIALDALELQLDRISMGGTAGTDHDRALRFMAKQYARHLEKLAQRMGSWEAAGVRIRELVEEERGAARQEATTRAEEERDRERRTRGRRRPHSPSEP